jgi:hypothetical protein
MYRNGCGKHLFLYLPKERVWCENVSLRTCWTILKLNLLSLKIKYPFCSFLFSTFPYWWTGLCCSRSLAIICQKVIWIQYFRKMRLLKQIPCRQLRKVFHKHFCNFIGKYWNKLTVRGESFGKSDQWNVCFKKVKLLFDKLWRPRMEVPPC